MNRTSTILLAGLVFALAPAAAEDPELAGAGRLARAVADAMELVPGDCPPFVASSLGRDRVAVCGSGPKTAKQVGRALDQALGTGELAGLSLLSVLDWHEQAPSVIARSFWLGAASLEVLCDKRDTSVVVMVSRPYGRCGPEVPFMPSPAEAGTSNLIPPLMLQADSYPDRAAFEKRDGSVALSVEILPDGSPRVACIHHATPADYGFELPAIETARKIDAAHAMRDRTGEERRLTIVVQFSKADERPRGTRIKYH